MAGAWPDRLVFGGQPLIEAEAVLAAALPDEGCALLLGALGAPAAGGGPWRVTTLWPCLNSWQPAGERRRHFAIDPREQLLAQKWARVRGWCVLGSLHSHPTSCPEPSVLDAQLAVRPCLLVIAAPSEVAASAEPGEGLSPRSWRLRAWWLADGGAHGVGAGLSDPQEIPLQMDRHEPGGLAAGEN